MGYQFLIEEPPTEKKSYTEIFNECFPLYLSIGMSYAEYWDGNPSLTRYYRKAFQLKQEHEDHVAWLNGVYVYEALSTALYNMFGRGKGKSGREYANQPFSIKREQVEELPSESKVVEAKAQASVWMEHLVNKYK